jgi:hypothetical protein
VGSTEHLPCALAILARAQNFPIDLEVTLTVYDPDLNNVLCQLTSNRRFKDLSLMLSRYAQFITPDYIPSEELDLSTLDHVQDLHLGLIHYVPSSFVQCNFHDLQAFHVYSSNIIDLKIIGIPWSQLRWLNLSISAQNLQNIFHLLPECSSLEECELFIVQDSHFSITGPCITLHNL